MATFVFHNNFHRYNHHTIALSGFPESAVDPIASEKYPFNGLLYNNCSDHSGNFVGSSNSYNWYSTFITVTSNYIEWNKYRTTYTTVNSNSANWQGNKPLYTTYKSLSDNWNSMHNTYDAELNVWLQSIDGYNLYGDRVQGNTAQKTFSASFINKSDLNNIVWDLSSLQVGMLIATENVIFSGFSGSKRGGLYNLMLVTDATCYSALSVTFNPDKFKFENNTNTFHVTGIHIRKFNFTSDGKYLHGKSYLYDITPPDRNIYYAGTGILLYDNGIPTNPITLDDGEAILVDTATRITILSNPLGLITLSDSFKINTFNGDELYPLGTVLPLIITTVGGGLTVVGNDPYFPSDSVDVVGTDYGRDFIFSFTTLSAASALSPYGELGSQDRIFVVKSNISETYNLSASIVNSLSASNSLLLPKCDTFESIEIFTKAYGYISKLIINDVETKDFVFKSGGYKNHETGHSIKARPEYDSVRTQSYFVEYGEPVPILTRSLSSGIQLWLDAMDYSTVDFLSSNNYMTGLSSRLSGNQMYFTSTSSTSSFYNTSPKQSFNYNLSSTHYRDMILSGNVDFVTFTLLTPSNSSKETEWLWANGNYGIFKIPQEYSLGIGTSAQYYKHTYGEADKNKPIFIATRYFPFYNVQDVFVNQGAPNAVMPLSTIFGYPDPNDDYTTIGGLNPLTGFSEYKLHEFIIYKEYKNDSQMIQIKDYLYDKWNLT